MTESNDDWRNRTELGNALGVRLVIFFCKYLGRPITQLLLLPICFFFFLTVPKARSSSSAFLCRVGGEPINNLSVFKHIYWFAKISVDRVFFSLLPLSRFKVEVQNEDVFFDIESTSSGALLFISHLGNFDALRAVGEGNLRKPLRLLIDTQVNPNAMQAIIQLNPELASNIIDRSHYSGPSLMLKLREEVDKGCLIGIMVDRMYGEEQSITLSFLGSEARFPRSPWEMALVLEVPVIICFGLFKGKNEYSLKFEKIAALNKSNRKMREQQILESCKTYVNILEQTAKSHPYNWMNFYDFWSTK